MFPAEDRARGITSCLKRSRMPACVCVCVCVFVFLLDTQGLTAGHGMRPLDNKLKRMEGYTCILRTSRLGQE